MSEILAIIPARGGSKEIPKKNIKILGKYPLIAYSIYSARQIKSINRIIVSTDDDEIAEISKKYGAEVPFKRPSEFAQDNSPDRPLFIHALDWLEKNDNYFPKFVLHLRPTSPFRTNNDIENVIQIWRDTNCDSVRSVNLIDAKSHPYWAYVEADGLGYNYISDPEIRNNYNLRQSLPPLFQPNGLVDGYTPESIRNSNDMLGEKLMLYKVKSALDIDTNEDFDYASYLLERNIVNSELPTL